MCDRGVLLSTDGSDRNVIKIKPPLVFSTSDADQLVDSLDDVLSETWVTRDSFHPMRDAVPHFRRSGV